LKNQKITIDDVARYSGPIMNNCIKLKLDIFSQIAPHVSIDPTTLAFLVNRKQFAGLKTILPEFSDHPGLSGIYCVAVNTEYLASHSELDSDGLAFWATHDAMHGIFTRFLTEVFNGGIMRDSFFHILFAEVAASEGIPIEILEIIEGRKKAIIPPGYKDLLRIYKRYYLDWKPDDGVDFSTLKNVNHYITGTLPAYSCLEYDPLFFNRLMAQMAVYYASGNIAAAKLLAGSGLDVFFRLQDIAEANVKTPPVTAGVATDQEAILKL
jgi:hypothetical protein